MIKKKIGDYSQVVVATLLLGISSLVQAQQGMTYYLQSYNSALYLSASPTQAVYQVQKNPQTTQWVLDDSGGTDGGVLIKNASGECLSVDGKISECTKVYFHYINAEDMSVHEEWCTACRYAITNSPQRLSGNNGQLCLTADAVQKDSQTRSVYSKSCDRAGYNQNQQFRIIPAHPELLRKVN